MLYMSSNEKNLNHFVQTVESSAKSVKTFQLIMAEAQRVIHGNEMPWFVNNNNFTLSDSNVALKNHQLVLSKIILMLFDVFCCFLFQCLLHTFYVLIYRMIL